MAAKGDTFYQRFAPGKTGGLTAPYVLRLNRLPNRRLNQPELLVSVVKGANE